MGMFKDMTTDALETSEDRLGGGRGALATNVYDAVIKVAYAGESDKGAKCITFVLEASGQEVRETVYFTKKTGEHFYFDKDDKTKQLPLPGFTTVNDICLMATGEGLAEQNTADKMVKIYNFDSRKEEPTEVPVLTALTGKKIKVGLSRVIEPVQKRVGEALVPQYEDNGKLKTRSKNEIKKVFHAESGRTVNEVLNAVEKPEFLTAWVERFKDKDDDSAVRELEGAAKGGAGASGSGRPAAAGGAPATAKKKLFGG